MSGKLLRSILNPISIVIGKDATRTLLQVTAAVAMFVPGGQPLAAALTIELALLYKPTPPKPDATQTALKGPLSPRVRAYGRSRLYWTYGLYVTSPNGVAFDIGAIVDTGGNSIDGFERIYLGDQSVATGAGVVVGLTDGTYGRDAVEIDLRLGEATETAFAQATAELGDAVWDDDHRGDGVATAMVKWSPVPAKHYQEVFPNGQPVASFVGRWLRVFDWRDEAQSVDDPSTWTWTENAWLHYANYELVIDRVEPDPGQMFPSGAALQAAWDRYFAPTLDLWTAAADDADAEMDLKAGGTEPRYRSCVAHNLTDLHKDTKARILACCDGWVAEREDGALVPYSGRFYEPTVTIGPDEITGYSWQDGVEDESALNQIAVSYISADSDYNTVETTAWEDSDDIASRGKIAATTLSNDVPSHAQARRLAKRAMAKAMAPYRGTVTTSSRGRGVVGQRFIHLLIEEGGATFYDGPAEITQLTRNLASGGMTFGWLAADANVDAWNPETEEGDPAANSGSVAPEPLPTPEITSATVAYSDVGSGDDGLGGPSPVSGARVLIVATADGIADRTDLTWYARWRVGSSSSWNEREYPDSDPGAGVTILTEYVPLVVNLNVEVAYGIGDGRISLWSDPEVVDTTA